MRVRGIATLYLANRKHSGRGGHEDGVTHPPSPLLARAPSQGKPWPVPLPLAISDSQFFFLGLPPNPKVERMSTDENREGT